MLFSERINDEKLIDLIMYTFLVAFRLLDGYKYHKKDLTYMECVNDTWIVDELKDRPRVTPQENVQLSSVLQRSADLERGDGLLPVGLYCFYFLFLLFT